MEPKQEARELGAQLQPPPSRLWVSWQGLPEVCLDLAVEASTATADSRWEAPDISLSLLDPSTTSRVEGMLGKQKEESL